MKKFLASLLVAVIAIALVPQGLFTIDVHAATSGNFTYTVSNGEATINDFPTDYEGALIIPSTLDGYPVMRIGITAFENCTGLTSVVIPDSVTSIGFFAFNGCIGLTSVTIGDSVEIIDVSSFQGCTGLTSVVIPNSVIRINNGAFFGCYKLKSVGYTGSEADQSSITIEYGNDYLLDATWYYNCCGEGNHTYTDGCDDICNNCQFPRIGEHIYDNSLDQYCNLCDHVRTFEEFPIVSLSATPQTFIEKTNGYTTTDHNGNTYFHYHASIDNYILTMADGLTFSGYGWEIRDLTGAYPYSFASQSYAEQWGLGDHTVTLELGHITGEATITIIENPIASITSEPITVVEGTNGYPQSEGNDGENVWFRYQAYDPTLTLIMKDGTSFTGGEGAIYAKYGVYPSYNNDQSYDNPWGVGPHSMTVSIGDVTGTVPYIITESPIASIRVEPITIYENTNGYSTHDWQTNTEYFEYFYPSLLNVIVTYKNGTTETISYEDCYDALDMSGSIYDDQSGSNPWGLGEHKATLCLGHLSCEVDITIAPSPIERIEWITLPKTEYVSGEFLDLSGGVLRVHFNDGTSEDISISYFNGIDFSPYYCDKMNSADSISPSEIQLVDSGEHDIIVSYFGKSTTFTVAVSEKTIKSVSINDDNKNIIVTLTFDDNTTQTITVLRFVARIGDTGLVGDTGMWGEVYTDQGIYFGGFITSDDGSVRMEINDVSSNILPNGCDWYDMYWDKQGLDVYSSYLWEMLSHFTSFDGKITADNIDAIINYTRLIHDIPTTHTSDGYAIDGLGNGGYWYSGLDLRNFIMQTFAVDHVDLSLSAHYDSENDRYPACGNGATGDVSAIPSLTYKNGYWEMYWAEISSYPYSYARFDEDGRILRFSHGAPIVTYGDPTDDMVVDSRDLVLIRKFMANFDYDTNTSTVEVAGGADTNGDDVIDARDLVLLRQYFANYDYDSGSSSVVLGPQN